MLRKKRLLAVALALCLLCSLFSMAFSGVPEEAGHLEEVTASGTAFSDVPKDAWYLKEVTAMKQGGIIKGYTDGTFGPERDVSRGEFVVMTARCLGLEQEPAPGEYWCGATLELFFYRGWFPWNWTLFGPMAKMNRNFFEKAITREEAVYVLMEALTPADQKLGVEAKDIVDYDQMDPRQAPTILAAYNAGVANGLSDGRFDPKGHLTRAQAVAILYRTGYTATADSVPLEGKLTILEEWDGERGHYTHYELALTADKGVREWTATLSGEGDIYQGRDCDYRQITPNQVELMPVSFSTAIPEGQTITVEFLANGPKFTLTEATGRATPTAMPVGQP